VASVEVLNHYDARIVSKRPVKLPVPDVERDHPCRAAREEYVGESAGRCANVERFAPSHEDPECVKSMRQLQAAASDVRVVGRDERELRTGFDSSARFRHYLSVNADLRCED
jgi:hypothetical protein